MNKPTLIVSLVGKVDPYSEVEDITEVNFS